MRFLLITLVAALSAAALGARAQIPAFHAGVDLVSLGVTVTDKRGTLVTNLSAEDFEVVEDGSRQTVTEFAVGRGGPGQAPALHLGLLLDTSESMGEDMRFTKTAAVRFLQAQPGAVDVTVVDFDTEVRAARYGQRDFARVVEHIRQQKTGGSTALYDAIAVYLDRARADEGRKIMLLYTDGGDTTSAVRYGELLDQLRASDVTVHVIGQLEHQTPSVRNGQRFILQQIADTTGGQAFFPVSIKDLDAAYTKVLTEINAQYLLGYQSTNTKADGAWRKVEIKVKKGGDYRIRSRKGYFAPYRKP